MLRIVSRTTSGMSMYAVVLISPATTTSPVVAIDSHATRLSGSSARIASRTESEIASQSLSGWPSVTDSDVNVYRLTRWLLFDGSLAGARSRLDGSQGARRARDRG